MLKMTPRKTARPVRVWVDMEVPPRVRANCKYSLKSSRNLKQKRTDVLAKIGSGINWRK